MGIKVAFSDVARLDDSTAFVEDYVIQSLCTDTRKIKSGDTYLAIVGEHFDGHEFIENAIEAGAAAVIVSCDVDVNVPVLRVADTVAALGYIARLYRDQLPAVVIGITGSNGKTTVKGMLQSVCELYGSTTATVANNNNTIGVPLTLLSASREDKTIVVEMGTSEKGEIPQLVSIVHPDISIIINISESHLSGLGSRDDVFEEKSAIISGAKSNATVIVNLDDAYAKKAVNVAGDRNVVTYGFTQQADVKQSKHSERIVSVDTPGGSLVYQLLVLGQHNVSNSLAVTAIAQAANIDNQTICQGLENYSGTNGRLQIQQLGEDITLIDDTYNANPASSHAALDVLAGFHGRKLFAYGGMAELGDLAEEMHKQVGRKADEVGVDQLYIYGPDARPTYEAFSGEKYYFDEIDDLSQSISDEVFSGDTVLVKGSRRYKMERVCQYLQRGAN